MCMYVAETHTHKTLRNTQWQREEVGNGEGRQPYICCATGKETVRAWNDDYALDLI